MIKIKSKKKTTVVIFNMWALFKLILDNEKLVQKRD